MHVEKLSITPPADVAQLIRRQVASGSYSSNSEVVLEALSLWQERQVERESQLNAIRAKIQEAIDDPMRLTGKQLQSHFDQRFAKLDK